MKTSHPITRQQLAGWILAVVPTAVFIGSLFNIPQIIHNIGKGYGWSESLGFLVTAGFTVGLLMLAIGLIRNDIHCRPAMIIYSAFSFLMGIIVPVICLIAPGHASMVIIWEIPHPGIIHYALFFSIFFVLFGIPHWLLVRRPAAPLFASDRHNAA